ncbi:hypothetical protein [Candidatus Clostridium radicumherbarum]|uniref:Uncharacterized protein n=1 Tax=Candidatus Clostridium radicumherbarum TaxID=3381662 RepID=A0ABW8TV86_9CLOT
MKSAHGYFLSLLLSETFNCRKDIYGIDRTLAIREIISKITETEPGIILDLRISLLEGINSKDEDLIYKSSLLSKLVDTEVDIISISNGIYNINKDMIYPPKSDGSNVYLDYGIYFSKKYPKKIWNIAGNIDDFYVIDKIEAENLTFSIGRLLLSDPYAIVKASRFDDDKINNCNGCNRCHYYSHSEGSLTQCI